MSNRVNVYEQITQQIIAQLEEGVPPWRRPWAAVSGGLPSNIVSGRPYRGVNILLLWATAQVRGYDSNLWATFRQWKSLNGHVNKGERATKIVFWRVVSETEIDQATGEEIEDRRFFARQYSVFNLNQCGGDALDQFKAARPDREFTDFGPAEDAIAATGADIRYGGGRAYYDHNGDFIRLPERGSFESQAAMYGTLLHELTHWSGNESRLDRIDKLSRFGSESYAVEELVAELGASFLTATLGVPNAGIQDNAAYLRGWLDVLKSDSRAIFTASTAASEAADFILSFSEGETVEATEELAEIPV